MFKKIQESKIHAIRYFPGGSFAVHIGDHLRFGIISGLGIICGRGSLAALYTSHEDHKKLRNNRVFISDSIILANIFCTTRGLDLCGPTIELLCRLKFLDRNIANWKDRRTNSLFFASLTREILFLPLEHKIRIFSPPCNILYISH